MGMDGIGDGIGKAFGCLIGAVGILLLIILALTIFPVRRDLKSNHIIVPEKKLIIKKGVVDTAKAWHH